MDHSIIILYFPNNRSLTLNLYHSSKTLYHFPFHWSYGANEVVRAVVYGGGVMVVNSDYEIV